MWYAISLGYTVRDPVRLWPDDGPWGLNKCHFFNLNKYSCVDGTLIYVYIWYQHQIDSEPFNIKKCAGYELAWNKETDCITQKEQLANMANR
jgi:hypothetical protein